MVGALDGHLPVPRLGRAALVVGVEEDDRGDPARDLGEDDTYVLSEAPIGSQGEVRVWAIVESVSIHQHEID